MFLCDDVLNVIFEYFGELYLIYISKQFYRSININHCIVNHILRQKIRTNTIYKLKNLCKFIITNKIKININDIDKYNDIILSNIRELSKCFNCHKLTSNYTFYLNEIKYIIIDVILIDLNYNIYPKKYLSDSIFICNSNHYKMEKYWKYDVYMNKINEISHII